jgi:hypothetical protein
MPVHAILGVRLAAPKKPLVGLPGSHGPEPMMAPWVKIWLALDRACLGVAGGGPAR